MITRMASDDRRRREGYDNAVRFGSPSILSRRPKLLERARLPWHRRGYVGCTGRPSQPSQPPIMNAFRSANSHG